MTLVLAHAAGLDRLRLRQVAGLAVAFAGVAVVIGLGTGQELSLESTRGPLLVLGAPLSFAFYNVVLKPLLGRYNLLALTAASSLVGMVGLVPFVRGSTVDAVSGGSAADLLLLLYLGVLATFLGYILWNAGLRGLGPTRAVTYTYAISPLAILIGAVALDEALTAWLVLGGALVVGGIALAQRTLASAGAASGARSTVPLVPWVSRGGNLPLIPQKRDARHLGRSRLHTYASARGHDEVATRMSAHRDRDRVGGREPAIATSPGTSW